MIEPFRPRPYDTKSLGPGSFSSAAETRDFLGDDVEHDVRASRGKSRHQLLQREWCREPALFPVAESAFRTVLQSEAYRLSGTGRPFSVRESRGSQHIATDVGPTAVAARALLPATQNLVGDPRTRRGLYRLAPATLAPPRARSVRGRRFVRAEAAEESITRHPVAIGG